MKKKNKSRYKMKPARQDKDKIRMLKSEITQMKREHYEFFQEHLGEKQEKEPYRFDYKIPVFLFGAFLVAFGVLRLLSVFEFEKVIYLGERVIPQQTPALLFIAGVVMLYFVKEKSAPVILMILGIAATAGVFIISGKPEYIPLEGAALFFAAASVTAGAVICGVTVYINEKSK